MLINNLIINKGEHHQKNIIKMFHLLTNIHCLTLGGSR